MSFVEYAEVDRVAVVTLNRPEANNAQNAQLLADLDAAFSRAVAERNVRVIVLRAEGKHFSAGHDISPAVHSSEPWASMWDHVGEEGLLKMYTWELQHYFGYSRRWRDLPKPTIAAVQGACIAAGLMLAWPMDLIVAADNAKFSDPVALMGIGGVEYHGHTWELGHRKAKELLFTGEFVTAEEARQLGMVNRVVPLADLDDQVMALAHKISRMHPHGVLMAKRAVNHTLDAQGQHMALAACFETHSLGHANAYAATGKRVTLASLAEMTDANKANAKET